MFKKKPILQYESAVEIYPNIITPAKNHVPEWYKKIPKWKNNEVLTMGKGFNLTVKQCFPFLDSFTTGYMIVLSNDLYVKNDNGVPYISWSRCDFPPTSRGKPIDANIIPTGHYPLEFALF
jgi:hypothetical protein